MGNSKKEKKIMALDKILFLLYVPASSVLPTQEPFSTWLKVKISKAVSNVMNSENES